MQNLKTSFKKHYTILSKYELWVLIFSDFLKYWKIVNIFMKPNHFGKLKIKMISFSQWNVSVVNMFLLTRGNTAHAHEVPDF